uniref:Uncharacterized protein n=1 Tax=Xenopus tropicalis TaxID=8364 RepID=A0A1B8Y9B7_XENTR
MGTPCAAVTGLREKDLTYTESHRSKEDLPQLAKRICHYSNDVGLHRISKIIFVILTKIKVENVVLHFGYYTVNPHAYNRLTDILPFHHMAAANTWTTDILP